MANCDSDASSCQAGRESNGKAAQVKEIGNNWLSHSICHVLFLLHLPHFTAALSMSFLLNGKPSAAASM